MMALTGLGLALLLRSEQLLRKLTSTLDQHKFNAALDARFANSRKRRSYSSVIAQLLFYYAVCLIECLVLVENVCDMSNRHAGKFVFEEV